MNPDFKWLVEQILKLVYYVLIGVALWKGADVAKIVASRYLEPSAMNANPGVSLPPRTP